MESLVEESVLRARVSHLEAENEELRRAAGNVACLVKGWASVARENFAEAEALFTQGLESKGQASKNVLFQNRSCARIKLNQPELALQDATEAVEVCRRDLAKAYKTQASAHWMLEQCANPLQIAQPP